MADFSEFLKGYDENRVQDAMKKAKMLSENPRVQEAFARVDKEEIVKVLRNFNDTDKKQLMKTFLNSNNQELIRLIQKLK